MRAVLVVMAGVSTVVGCAAEKGGEPAASAPAASSPSPPPMSTTPGQPAPEPPRMSEGSATDGTGPKGGGGTVYDSDPCAGGKIIQDSSGTTVTGSGQLDKGAIHDAMHKQGAAMGACRTAAIARGLAHDQRVEVRFTITTTGDFTDVHATGGDDGQLTECIAQVFRTLHVGPSSSPANVVYPLIIKAP
jgi:hypothetical protein